MSKTKKELLLTKNIDLLLKFHEFLKAEKCQFVDVEDGVRLDYKLSNTELDEFIKLYNPNLKRITTKTRPKLTDDAFNYVMKYAIDEVERRKKEEQNANNA